VTIRSHVVDDAFLTLAQAVVDGWVVRVEERREEVGEPVLVGVVESVFVLAVVVFDAVGEAGADHFRCW
jgi:hypothetical protein